MTANALRNVMINRTMNLDCPTHGGILSQQTVFKNSIHRFAYLLHTIPAGEFLNIIMGNYCY